MTAQCGGGTSGPKVTSTFAVRVASAYAADLLEGVSAGWLAVAIPFLVIPELVLDTFCASDPPAYPTFTSNETTALTQLDVGSPDFGTGLPKAIQLVERLAWFDNCHCTSGSLTPNTNPTTPTNVTVTINPSPNASAPCATVLMQSTYDTTALNTTVPIPTLNPAPANFTSLTGTWQWAEITAGMTGTISFIPYINGVLAGTQESSPKLQWSGGNIVIPFTIPIPVGCTELELHVQNTGTAGRAVGTLTANAYCGGGSGVPAQPCCPPDTTTQYTLNAILQMVTLIQRQAVPFGYVDGTVHSGLTGQGVLNVQGLLGVRLSPSTIPPGLGVEVGDPDTLWLDSWINWGNPDGWLQREWLRTAPQISMPNFAGQFTQIGYSFVPGLVVDVTELVREP